MNRCRGTKRDNSPCTVTVEPPQNYCWWHDPAHAEQRKQAASKGGKRGGRGRPMTELHSVRAKLETLVEDVLEGRVERSRAAVAGQLYNTLIRSISVELRVKEQLELEARLDELEATLERRGEGYPYGS
jgi:hypothetical protein